MVRVAVVGGGFGGVYAIRALQRSLPGAEILLFEPRDRFVFTPLLHEVATDVLHIPSVTHVYEDIFLRKIRHVRKAVTQVDFARNRLRAGGTWHAYDYVILAHGARTRQPPKHAFTLKGTEDALAIRRAVERIVLRAATRKGERAMHCIVVGGGPTGVELAGELIEFLRYRARKEHIDPRAAGVTIVQSGPILAQADARIRAAAEARLSRNGVTVLDARVDKVDAGGVTALVKGEPRRIASRCVIWTAGVVPNRIALRHVQPLKDHVPVDRTLQVQGFPNAFAIGDASMIVDDPLPDLAQVATKQGTHAARSIARMVRGQRPLPFRYAHQGFLLSIGQRYATGRIKGVFVKGFFAWFIWRTVYLAKFIGVRSKARLAFEYTCRIFRPRDHSEKMTND